MYQDDRYYAHWPADATGFPAGALKLRTFGRCVDALLRFERSPTIPPRLLDIGCAQGQMLEAAKRRGLVPVGLEISPGAEVALRLGFEVYRCEVQDAPLSAGSFDFVTMVDVIEHVAEPLELLASVRRLLRPGGLLLLLTPDAASLSARLTGTRWPHYKVEHLLYFSRRSLAALLPRCGFAPVASRPALKFLSIDYVLGDFRRYGQIPFLAALPRFERLLPAKLRGLPVPVPSGLMLISRAAVDRVGSTPEDPVRAPQPAG
jgi:SAM-dependent methyltransferase